MSRKFKPGDRVYHKNLKLYGIFVDYAWNSDDECYVDFEMEDGEIEQIHVSVNWLIGENEVRVMEFIIENITDEETKILEREGFEWYPDDINSNDVVINGDSLYYRMVLHALRRD